MRLLNSIAKIVVVAIVITIFIMVVTSCGYVAGDGNATVNIDRKLDVEIDSTITKKEKTK